jgi:hypothetical protein
MFWFSLIAKIELRISVHDTFSSVVLVCHSAVLFNGEHELWNMLTLWRKFSTLYRILPAEAYILNSRLVSFCLFQFN